jgi:hypothetical protein
LIGGRDGDFAPNSDAGGEILEVAVESARAPNVIVSAADGAAHYLTRIQCNTS